MYTLEEGNAACDAGDYESAFAIFLSLAEAGNVDDSASFQVHGFTRLGGKCRKWIDWLPDDRWMD